MAKPKKQKEVEPVVKKEDSINAKIDLTETLDQTAENAEQVNEVIQEVADLSKDIKPSYHANPHAMYPCNAGEPWCEWGYQTKHPIESVKNGEYFKTCVNGLLKRNDVVIALVDSDYEHWRGKFVVCEADPKSSHIKVKLIEEYKI